MHSRQAGFDHEVRNAFLSPDPSLQRAPLCLVVLNYVLPAFVHKLWQRSSARVFGDGGANRFFDLLPELLPEQDPSALRTTHLPDAICGDLDSIRPDVLQFYRAMGVTVRDLSHDQDSTDAEKCLSYLREQDRGSDPLHVCVVGALGGRLDHTLSNLHTLHIFGEMETVMIGEGDCARLLKPGKTKIAAQVDPDVEGPKCALVPLNGAVCVSASGLRWPLNAHELKFDGLISTSNCMVSDVVVVETSGPVLWITKLKEAEIARAPM